MKSHDLTKERTKTLREMYDAIVRNNSVNKNFLSRRAIVNIIYESSAPRFYIGAKEAERYVLGYYRGDPRYLTPRKKKKAEDLAKTYERLRKRHPYATQYRLWEMVVNSPAESFYLSPMTISCCIFHHKHYNDARERKRNL